MQIERLVRMIFYIVSHKQVTARELADYFEVSTRTIYRDMNTLTLSGIPVISKKGTGGGISLMDGYALNKSFLTAEEQVQVYPRATDSSSIKLSRCQGGPEQNRSII